MRFHIPNPLDELSFGEDLRSYATLHGRLFEPSKEMGHDQFFKDSLAVISHRKSGWGAYRNQAGVQFKCDFGISFNDNMNAVSGKESATYCHLAFTGLFRSYMELFVRLFSHPAAFPFIGNPALEDATTLNRYPGIPGFSVFSAAEGQRWFDVLQGSVPKCPIRRQTAFYMAHLTTLYVWHHELGHSLGGHLDFAQAALMLGSLYEFPTENKQKNLIAWWLEFEADDFALASMVWRCANQKFEFRPLSLSTLPDKEMMILVLSVPVFFLWTWAIEYTLSQAIHMNAGEKPDLSRFPEQHPSPRHRIYWHYNTAERLRRAKYSAIDLPKLYDTLDEIAVLSPMFVFLSPGLILGVPKTLSECESTLGQVQLSGIENAAAISKYAFRRKS